jgi:hypothetical protein
MFGQNEACQLGDFRMASILLSYVDSDKPSAATLAKLLEGAGHAVSSTDPDGLGLRSREHVDCMIVVWSAAAVASPYVYEDARVALTRRKLVQVFTSGFDQSMLAPVFRTQPLLPIEDHERIVRDIVEIEKERQALASTSITQEVIARPDEVQETPKRARSKARSEPEVMHRHQDVFTSAPDWVKEAFGRAEAREEERSELNELAFRRETPPPIPSELCKAALKKEAGQLAYQVPKTMRRGVAEIVEVRLGLAHRKVTIGFMGSGDIAIENLPIVETMTVSLYGSPGAFQITRQSRGTQLVTGTLIRNASLDHDRFGRWLWEVTPKRVGTQELIIKVSADLSDSRGVATSESYPDRTFTVSVRVNYGSASMRVVKWTATGAVTGLAGAYTHHVWWPKVKVMLTNVGWLS